jgi:Protein of unknown function (DUF2815)
MRITTGMLILSYPQLFVAKAPPKKEGEAPGEPQYSTALCGWGENAEAEYQMLEQALDSVGIAKWGEAKYRSLRKNPNFKFALRTDVEKYEKDERNITFFLNTRSKNKPGIVSRFKGPDGRPTPITDKDEMYPGCFVRATLTAFAYEHPKSKGCSFSLNNIQKLGDGTRLDTKVDAQDDFDADMNEAPAALDDLTG